MSHVTVTHVTRGRGGVISNNRDPAAPESRRPRVVQQIGPNNYWRFLASFSRHSLVFESQRITDPIH